MKSVLDRFQDKAWVTKDFRNGCARNFFATGTSVNIVNLTTFT